MSYNVWNKWDPLEVCMLGNNYAPEFFDGLPNNVATPLKRICEETLQDLEGYKNILQQFGVQVIQPTVDPGLRFTDNPTRYPRGPLQPRDCHVIIGDTAFQTHHEHPAIVECLKNYNSNIKSLDSPISKKSFYGYRGLDAPDWPEYNQYLQCWATNDVYSAIPDVHNEIATLTNNEGVKNFPTSAPSITVIGKDIYLDMMPDSDRVDTYSAPAVVSNHLDQFTKMFPNFRHNKLSIGGHNDASFAAIKPGAILSLKEIQHYDETFPEWDVCYLPDQSWDKVSSFLTLKRQNAGKWWLAGEEDNHEFTRFVETWLTEWVGYVEETVFDVNVLVLDEKHVCVSQPNNQQINTFLKKHGLEPIYVRWRHRYFWDGGLHCITLDLKRKGLQEDYFPHRTASIIDKGF